MEGSLVGCDTCSMACFNPRTPHRGATLALLLWLEVYFHLVCARSIILDAYDVADKPEAAPHQPTFGHQHGSFLSFGIVDVIQADRSLALFDFGDYVMRASLDDADALTPCYTHVSLSLYAQV